MKTFKLSNQDLNGTCLMAEITCSYKDLVSLFGKPNDKGDGYKVSTMWVLKDEDGNVCDIYDYKQTRLYDRQSMTIKAFRSLPSYSWHIGAHNKAVAKHLCSYIQHVLQRQCVTRIWE